MTDKQIDEALEALAVMERSVRSGWVQIGEVHKREIATIRQALEWQRVPEGWKLVPVEPTGEMLWDGFPLLDDEDARRHYKALLAAAPEPPDPIVDKSQGMGPWTNPEPDDD